MIFRAIGILFFLFGSSAIAEIPNISEKDLSALLKPLIMEESGFEMLDISFSNSSHYTISNSRPESLKIKTLSIDNKQKRFTSVIEADQGVEIPVSGKYEEAILLPVLSRKIQKGEIIKEGDIEIVEHPKRFEDRNIVLKKEDLIGKIVKNNVLAKSPVPIRSIDKPIMVKKNNSISMVYRAPSIEILAKGTAMQDGALGDTVSIKNVSSGAIVHGKVVSDNQVIIISGME